LKAGVGNRIDVPGWDMAVDLWDGGDGGERKRRENAFF